ncbi:thiamine pyrophosphate-dependent enzyme [Sphingobium lactosutens]|uniref:thiamine pyrophosphate-dependent enzyme n=1 Tax=Sphingobium lactosutens TaxID=522773 RepID=UPI001C4B0DD3|nr:thiamine pyrophosphate-dependent enzyme [Sphingobium lactosutens]
MKGMEMGSALLERRDAVVRLLSERSGAIVVSGLGSATYDVAAAGDNDRNFYLWGAMGGAAMIGLGIALAQPDVPVIVVTGDGEMLMGLGGFATISQKNPANLTVVVLDNELYGETGEQHSHTSKGADLGAVAAACGIRDVRTVRSFDELAVLAARSGSVGEATTVAVVKIDPGETPRVLPSRDGALIKTKVRASLGLDSM